MESNGIYLSKSVGILLHASEYQIEEKIIQTSVRLQNNLIQTMSTGATQEENEREGKRKEGGGNGWLSTGRGSDKNKGRGNMVISLSVAMQAANACAHVS